MQSKSEFEIAQAGSTPDFKILSPATLPALPISPKKFIIAGIGLVASIVIVVFFVGFLYLINNKITNIIEIERASDVPVLGVIPSSLYSTTEGLHVVDHPKSMVSEAIRTLRTNLDFFAINSAKRVIAVSSTVSGEGKSFVAMNLGGVIALSKKKVILLDLDMRKAKNNLATDDNTKGISTILIRKNAWQECVLKTDLDNFDFIPSGPHPPNPSELLLNGEFTGILEELKKSYDFIILDTPPVGLVTDGIMAMRRADLSIYVFRANYSKKEFLQNFRRIVNINKFTNITTLLNALPTSGDRSKYGYYEEPTRSGRLTSFFRK
jgi:capsular exopolysaccharide synthesis family protein